MRELWSEILKLIPFSSSDILKKLGKRKHLLQGGLSRAHYDEITCGSIVQKLINRKVFDIETHLNDTQ